MKKTKLYAYLLGLAVFSAAVPSFAKEKFDDLDLNAEDRLLFTAEHHVPGVPDYKSLFCTKLGPEKTMDSPRLLTCFPERMELLSDGKVLQVRNMYGLSRYSFEDGKILRVTENKKVGKTFSRTYPVCVSPDGKWYCSVETDRNASGKLVLVNSKTMLKKVLVESVDLDYSSLKVKWAPDSKAVLYESNNSVYFATPDAVFKNLQINESFRKIGEGSIDSVQWTLDRKLIFLKDDIIYKIEENELYTRGLYSSLVGSGEIIGRLPVSFDSITDKFWCNSNGSKLAVITKGNLLELYSISQENKVSYVKIDMMYTLTEMSGTCLNHRIIWNEDKQPLLWVDSLDSESSSKSSCLYSVEDEMKLLFQVRNSTGPVLSPDYKKIAYTDNGSIRVYDISLGREVLSDSSEPVVSFAWAGRTSIIVGGEKTVSYINYLTNENRTLFLSSVERAYWNNGLIMAVSQDGKKFYSYDAEKNNWNSMRGNEGEFSAKDRNGSYRVFISGSLNREYENTILVRYLSGKAITYSVYPQSIVEENSPKRVSLVFDAMENSDGLGSILDTLAEFKVRGTFFINGEFIRRYPQKTKLIANSSNECASLFYTTADLMENNFVVDANFITRGLARNEDEFFAVTGKELSLMWHAPNYHASDDVKRAGTSAGYIYVNAFDKYNDRCTYEQCLATGEEYMDSSELIDAIVSNLRDGMVIPVTIGKTAGTRKDYLYQKLDLLIAAILDNGYEIVGLRNLSNSK